MQKILKQQNLKTYRDKGFLSQGGIDPLTLQKIQKATQDHSHEDGRCRMVLDFNSNQFEGKVISAYKRFLKHTGEPIQDVLRRLIWYLTEDYSGSPIHPGYARILVKRFSRLSTQEQIKILKKDKIPLGNSKKENTKLYRAFLFREENIYKV